MYSEVYVQSTYLSFGEESALASASMYVVCTLFGSWEEETP